MSKKSNGNIQETIAAIDFIRVAKNQAPNNNETIQNMLTDNEKILLERLFQLSRPDKAPVTRKNSSSHQKGNPEERR